MVNLSTYSQRQELSIAQLTNTWVEEPFEFVAVESNEITLRVLLLVVGILLILVSILMLVNVYVNRKNRSLYEEQAQALRFARLQQQRQG